MPLTVAYPILCTIVVSKDVLVTNFWSPNEREVLEPSNFKTWLENKGGQLLVVFKLEKSKTKFIGQGDLGGREK